MKEKRAGNSEDLELENLRKRILNENEALSKLLRNLQSIDSETSKKQDLLKNNYNEPLNGKRKPVK